MYSIQATTYMIWMLKPLKQYDPNYLFYLIKEIIGSDLYESAWRLDNADQEAMCGGGWMRL